MSVSSTNNRNDYTGNGSVSSYSYTFRIFSANDLRVTVRSPLGVETLLTQTTHYTVSGVGLVGGGSVSLVNGAFAWLTSGNLTTGWALTIRRVVAITQLVDLRNQGAFFAETHEDQFDKFAMTDQQQQDEIDRSVKLPETIAGTIFDTELPATVTTSANRSLVINSGGNGFAIGPSTTEISNAQTSALNAATSATNALASATLASEWATKTSGTVDGVDYSSKYWAQQAQNSASNFQFVDLEQYATSPVTNPAANNSRVFFKTTGVMYRKTPAGAESPIGSRVTINPTSGQYPLTVDDNFRDVVILVDTSAARTITLPTPALGYSVTVKDRVGEANFNPITIARTGAVLIEGLQANYLCEAPFGVWTFVSDGTNWFLI